MRDLLGGVCFLSALASCSSPPNLEQTQVPTFESVRVVEELRIGRVDGPDDYVFGHVSEVEATLTGAMFVYDEQANSIRMYDEVGQFVRHVARAGQGPGEVQRVAALELTPEGKIAAWDPENLRISLFDSDGNFQESHFVESSLWAEHTLRVDRVGNYYVKAISSSTPQRPFDWEYEWLKVGPLGEPLGTIAVPPENNEPRELYVLSTPEGFRRPFTTTTLSTINRSGRVVSGRNTEYTLSIHDASGPGVWYAREAARRPVAPGERDLWEAARASFQSLGTETYDPVPAFKPHFREITVDHDGRVWVDRYTAAVHSVLAPEVLVCCPRVLSFNWRERPTFDVVREDGTWWATVEMPFNTVSMSRRGNHVWGRITGGQGEHYVVRWRLEPVSQRR